MTKRAEILNLKDFTYIETDEDRKRFEGKYRLKDVDNFTKACMGNMSDAYKMTEGKLQKIGNRPILGSQLMVGDCLESGVWWKCSTIKEILIDEEKYVRFRTTTSIYEWWSK